MTRLGGRARAAYWSTGGGMIAAGVLAAIVIGGGAALIFGGRHQSAPHRAAAAASPATSNTGCSLPAGSRDVSEVAVSPPAVSGWAQVGNMQVPQAPSTFGPQHTSGIWTYCYAHNPAGALLAAIAMWADTTAATSTAVARHLAVNIPPGALGNDELPSYVELAGYRYLSYTPQRADVEIVLSAYDKSYAEADTPMVWDSAINDWRVSLPPSGSLAAAPIDSSLQGYVPWSLS